MLVTHLPHINGKIYPCVLLGLYPNGSGFKENSNISLFIDVMQWNHFIIW